MSAQQNSGRKDWRWAQLGEVCEKITDGTHHSPVNGSQGTFKYITAKNIRPWGLDLSDITYIDAATHAEIFSRCDVRKDDVLMVKDGATTGRLALNTLDEPFSLLSSVGVLRPGPELLPKYLLYVLQSPSAKDRLLAQVAGVAITRLTLKKLKESCIPVAPLSEQHRIVTEIEEQLSRIEAGVAALKRVQANLKRYRAAALDWALSNCHGKSVPFRSVCAETSIGLDRGRADQSRDRSKIPYVKMNNVDMQGRVAFDDLVFIDASPDEQERFSLRNDDLLFNTRNSKELVGKIGLVKNPPRGAIFNNNLMRIRPTPELLPKFLLLQMCSQTFRSRMEHIKKATTSVAAIYARDLFTLEVMVPSLPVQERAVAEVDRRLSVVEELETQVHADLARSERLRQATLARAFAPGDRSR